MNRSLAACAAVLATSTAALLMAHEGHDVNTDPGPDGAGGIFESSNVILVSRMGLDEFNGIPLIDGADCWGYTSPAGTEFAIMTADAMVAFVDLTDPAEPVLISTIPHPSNLWCDVKVVNQHAYVCTEAFGGSIQIIDLTNIDSGSVSLVGSITDITITRAHNVIVDNLGQRLYLCGARNGDTFIDNGGVQVFDVSTPSDPQLLGAYGDTYVHDAQVHVFDSGPNAGKTIAFCFAAGEGIDIVDFTNPASPVRLSRTTYANIVYSHQGWFNPETNLLYQNDELDELNGLVSETTTRVFDCTDLANPQFMGTYTTGSPAIDHNLYLNDGFIYQANYRSGLRIFDSNTTPMTPTEVGYLDTYPANDDPDFSGAWSVYPYFDSGIVIVSDINRGLFITDPTYAISGGVPFEYEFPTPLPESVDTSGTTFTFMINDTNGAVDPDNVWFAYRNATNPPAPAPRHGGHVFETSQAIPLGGGMFEATFPPMACGDVLRYYFTAATDDGLDVISPFTSPIVGVPTEPFTAVYADAVSISIDDDFESDLGWAAGAPGDTANTGVWERVDPRGAYASSGAETQPEFDNTPDAGTLCFITGQQPSGDTSVGVNDVDGGITTLTSPVIDASAEGEAMLRFAVWFSNDAGGVLDDTFLIEISNNGGADWVEVETLTATTAGWETREFEIASILPPSDSMMVRFIAGDTGSPSLVEAGVDDFGIQIIQCLPGLPADINGDGVVDTADLGILIGFFGSNDPLADINNDGVVDTADLGILIGSFGAMI